jgi:hypothetical protein
LKVNIARVGAIDQDDRGAAGSNKGRANLNDEPRRRIILSIQRQGPSQVCRRVITINTGRKRQAAEISPAQVIVRWRNQAGEIGVGGSKVCVSLCRGRVIRTECAVGNNTRWESGDSCARTDSDVAGNLTGAGIGHSRSAQDGESLG